MALIEIKTCPEPVLRKEADRVHEVDKVLLHLVDSMFETMYDAPGVGLAAPQVGISRRIIVVDVDRIKGPFALINPEILSSSGKIIDEEGCLSIPGIKGDVVRAENVEIRGFDLDYKEVVFKAEGILARALQHEIDHINGCLFWDRIEKANRDILKRKYKKLLKEH